MRGTGGGVPGVAVPLPGKVTMKKLSNYYLTIVCVAVAVFALVALISGCGGPAQPS